MIKNSKSQVMVENMTTYAWAVLIILTVIFLTYYFGMWDFPAPRYCTLATGLNCYDFEVSSDSVLISLFNDLGGTITVNDIDLKDCQGNPESKTIKDNQQALFTIQPCTITTKKYSSDLNVTYTSESELEHTVRGEIRSAVV